MARSHGKQRGKERGRRCHLIPSVLLARQHQASTEMTKPRTRPSKRGTHKLPCSRWSRATTVEPHTATHRSEQDPCDQQSGPLTLLGKYLSRWLFVSNLQSRTMEMAQTIEYLPCNLEVLSLSSKTRLKNNNDKNLGIVAYDCKPTNEKMKAGRYLGLTG